MFLRMVSSCVVNLGCQTFEIHQFCILGVKRFASREHRTRDILPKRSATVPLDRRDGDDELRDFDDLELLKLIQEAGSTCYDMSHLLW